MRIAVALNHEPAVPPVVRHTNGALGTDDDLPAQQPNGSAPAAPASTAAKSAYPPPAPVPTQEGPRGIRFDFNLGCRITLPAGAWHVRLSDLDTGNILFATDSNGSLINSALLFGFALAQSPPVRMCTKTPAPPWCDAVRGDRAEKIPSAVLKPDYVGQARAFANQLADRLGCVDRE